MTTTKKNSFSRRLNLFRFAFGFRDHKYFKTAARRADIDLSQGHFADLFRSYIHKYWDDYETPGGWSSSDDIARAAPTDTTITRWLRGQSKPSRKQLPGIVAALNKILSDARSDAAFLKSKRTQDESLIKPKFKFHVENIDSTQMPGHQVAEAMGFPIDKFDDWWMEASGPSVMSSLSSTARGFLGVYYVYRLHADEDGGLQQDMLVIFENESRDGLRALLVGSSEPPWRGDVVLGQNTISVLLKRTGDIIGTQINAMSLVYRNGSDMLHGFRTRIVDGNVFNIAAYRVIIMKSDDSDLAGYVNDNLEEDHVAAGLMFLSKEISAKELAGLPELAMTREALMAPQPEFSDFDYIEKRSHNIFGLTRALTGAVGGGSTEESARSS